VARIDAAAGLGQRKGRKALRDWIWLQIVDVPAPMQIVAVFQLLVHHP
jgi:hypothetical protein